MVDSPIKHSTETTQEVVEHDECEVEDDCDTTDHFSFDSAAIESTSDHETSHRPSKDAPGWIRDVGNPSDPSVSHQTSTHSQSSIASTRETFACSEDQSCGAITPNLSQADFNDGNQFHSRLGAQRRHSTQSSKATTQIGMTIDDELLSKSSSESSRSSSLPPPGFFLPRKEIRDAIMYHEELGKALSTLALDPDMKCINDNGAKQSMASTNSTAISTLDTSDSSSSKSEFSCGSNRRIMLEQHVSFLQSHTINEFTTSTTSFQEGRRSGDCISFGSNNSFDAQKPFDDFCFPTMDNLQSLPTSATLCDVPKCISSPLSTPNSNILSDNMPQQVLENARKERIGDLKIIKDEIVLMMSEFNHKHSSDISSTVDTQLEKHLSKFRLEVSELSERLDNTTRALGNVQDYQENKENQKSRFPKMLRTPRAGNSMDAGGLLRELEKTFSYMETRIINTITSEIKDNAMQQRRMIEDIVEEKVSEAIAGSNQKITSDVEQILKQEIVRASAMALRDKQSPQTPSLRIGSLKKHSRIPQSPLLDIGGGARTTITPDNSCLQTGSSSISMKADDLTQRSLEDSFLETMKAIDEFVADCDEIASDFDKIALRMETDDVDSDPDCDTERFDVLIGTANGFVMF